MKDYLVLVSMFEGYGDIEFIDSDDVIRLYKKDDELEEKIGQFLSTMPRLGDPRTSKYIWILIARYHEESLELKEIKEGKIESDIDAVVFANSEKEAKELLKTHPIYIKDLQTTLEDGRDQQEYEEMDALEYIFSEGSQLCQLNGDFVKVPEKYHKLIKE